jgi:hypothetical protein
MANPSNNVELVAVNRSGPGLARSGDRALETDPLQNFGDRLGVQPVVVNHQHAQRFAGS